MSQYEVTWAGFGGQGIMVAGQLLAYAGIKEGKNVIWLPSYGPEMRGGTAYCTVVISEKRIGSPIINTPQAACVFNRPSFDKFVPKVRPGGLIVVNSSLINVKTDRSDLQQVYIPASQMAIDAGNGRATNIAVLGAFIGATGIVAFETVKKVLQEKLGKKKEVLDVNYSVLEQGYKLAQQALKEKARV